jgi:hypothetical protein
MYMTEEGFESRILAYELARTVRASGSATITICNRSKSVFALRLDLILPCVVDITYYSLLISSRYGLPVMVGSCERTK